LRCCSSAALAGEFVVDPESGIIYTRRPLDREHLSHYTLRVRAIGDVTAGNPGGGESPAAPDVAVVFIRVLDANDHAPEVTYPLPGSKFHFQQQAVSEGLRLACSANRDPAIRGPCLDSSATFSGPWGVFAACCDI